MLPTIKNSLALLLSISLQMAVISVYAENRYLYPGDLEADQYESNGIKRYKNQSDLRYPDDSQYYQKQKKSSWFEQSEHYKYGNFNAKVQQVAPLNQAVRGSAAINNRTRIPPNNARKNFRSPVYASDLEADKVLMDKDFINASPYNRAPREASLYRQDKSPVRIQYIPVPVPVYSMPDRMTQDSRLKGFNYLNPEHRFTNKKAINKQWNKSQSDPLSVFGAFPGGPSSFDSLYERDSENSETVWPFLSPGTMIPGYSKSEAFSSH